MKRLLRVTALLSLAAGAQAGDGLDGRLADAFNRSLSVAPQQAPIEVPAPAANSLDDQIKRAQLILMYQEAARVPPAQYQVVPPVQIQPAQPIHLLGPQLSCRSYRNMAGQIQTDCN